MGEIIHKAYKFRLMPSKKQEELLSKHFGCARFVYNHFLKEKQEDSFSDYWRDSISPELKGETIKQLFKMKREDVLREIDRLNNLSEYLDKETLEKIRKEK